ncbi:MAG: N-acetyl-gamma-glutamyl-phosphate reductase [Cytophagaceae bacterium]|jgi:N-acetyl-gamma-glutamyl-phosphate reductase|nr:N-acetyl-gamma-glutamyl-phosphate reductase [Cytophagaceae bacterium]
MIKIGIIGGAGYTGGELLRILVNHPNADIRFIHSNSNAGNPIAQVHSDLLGMTELKFTGELDTNIDVLFMCVGHGDAVKFIENNAAFFNAARFKVIDLSQDFRLDAKNAEMNLALSANSFVYGLPEMQREKIKSAAHIANPGCFATCLQLGLLPLAAAGKLQKEIHITAITGSTGAGQSLSASSHFSWRNNNMSVYKAFTHQHLKEIGQSLKKMQTGFNQKIWFVPYRGDFTRGIIASIYTPFDGTLDEAKQLYKSFYQDAPFTHVSEVNPDLKQVVNTNNAIVYLELHDGMLLIISMIDNLLKGASGQAVQNMNLLFGLPETEGLRLKAAAF